MSARKNPNALSESFFPSRLAITRGDLESYLSEALSQGGDYAGTVAEDAEIRCRISDDPLSSAIILESLELEQ